MALLLPAVRQRRSQRAISRRRRRAAAAVVAVLAAVLSAGLVVLTTPAAHADGPGVGTPWVVTLGDSYISGEAGRWAGSSNSSSSRADALGPTAYFDNASGTSPQCAPG